MRTTKPISTVSYNSPEYLQARLDELIKAKKISFWCFIHHEAEDDESGTKPHIHLFIEPAKLMQTEDLRGAFQELDVNHPGKPLGVIAFRLSKFDDWYMYCLHDASYLASKGQARRFHYKYEDFLASDSDDLLCRVRSIDLTACSPFASMQDAIKHGLSWDEYFMRGTVPLQQLRNYEAAFRILESNATFRNGRQTHTPVHIPVVDTETGEIIS